MVIGHPVGAIKLGHETKKIKNRKNVRFFQISNRLKIRQPETSLSISSKYLYRYILNDSRYNIFGWDIT